MTRLPERLSCECRKALPSDERTPIHPAAHKGFSHGAVVYAGGRPDYPSALLSWLRTALLLSGNSVAADLGAGTGKFTRLLMQTGAQVVAVEPVEAMRAQLIQGVPGIRALPGTADATTLNSGSVNAVTCAQAFHWFATREVLEEIHRVLAPQGKLGLVWNVRDESCDWVAGTPRQVIIDRTLSVSFIAALPDAEKAVVTRQLQTLIDTHPQLKDRSEITFPYRTHAYHCARI